MIAQVVTSDAEKIQCKVGITFYILPGGGPDGPLSLECLCGGEVVVDVDDAHARVAGDPAVDLVPHGSVEEDVERALLPRPPVRVQHNHARPHCQRERRKRGAY